MKSESPYYTSALLYHRPTLLPTIKKLINNKEKYK